MRPGPNLAFLQTCHRLVARKSLQLLLHRPGGWSGERASVRVVETGAREGSAEEKRAAGGGFLGPGAAREHEAVAEAAASGLRRPADI